MQPRVAVDAKTVAKRCYTVDMDAEPAWGAIVAFLFAALMTGLGLWLKGSEDKDE
jgi:hypothetical protein